MTLICAALAAAPDLDLLFRGHRTVSHSIGAVILVSVCATAMAALASRPVIRVALMCACAYASHLVLDWLGTDASQPTGIQAFWPLTDRWYISNLDLFAPVERRVFLSWPTIRQNLFAVAQEVAILGTVAWMLWRVRVKALAGLAPQVTRGNHVQQ
jgi:membrane-bound metal-dependent hydrolase YbcI (DUF457 family)